MGERRLVQQIVDGRSAHEGMVARLSGVQAFSELL
jgi:hypothetical protein